MSDCKCNAGYTGQDGVSCTECAAGKYKETEGSSQCSQCSPGKHSSALAVSDMAACLDCPRNTYSSMSNDMCHDCPRYAVSHAASSNISNCTCPPGYTGNPNGLMDSYHGAIEQVVRIPLVDTTGDTETYSVLGQGKAGKWTRVNSEYVINAIGFDPTTNQQGLATLTPHVVEGVWTVTKTNNGANNHDWTWNFASNEGQGIGFGIASATNVPGNNLFMATNGNPVATDNGGAGQLARAQQGDEGTELVSLGVPLDSLSPGPGFVINGDRIPSTTVGQANAGGYVIQGSASYGALTIA